MRAARLYRPGDVRVDDVPIPEVAPGEVLLRVRRVGLCGSDRHWFDEGAIGDSVLAAPLILGHEVVATVAAGARRGERVVLDPAIPCGHCPTCQRGDGHLCPGVRFAGHSGTDGGLRELMAWPDSLCVPVPERLDDEAAVLLEPLGVALHALDLGRVRPGTSAGVFGLGAIGQLLVQLLVAMRVAPLVAADPLPHRCQQALLSGGSAVVVSQRDEPAPAEFGLDVAFEVAGTDSAVAAALATVRPGGRVVLIGIPAGDRTSFEASLARRRGLTMLVCRRMRADDLRRAAHLMDQGLVQPAPLVTHRFALSDVLAAFTAHADYRGIKVVVDPGKA